MQETVSGSGISWAVCKSAPCSRQLTMPAPHQSFVYRPDALPAAQPTASKHCRHNEFIFTAATTILIISNHNSFRVLLAKNASGYLSAGDNIIIIIIIAGGTDLDDEDDHEAVHDAVCVVIGECRLQRSPVTSDTSAVFTCTGALSTPLSRTGPLANS